MDLFTLLDEIRIIARNGLRYTKELYDRERYERLMAAATQVYSETLDIPDGVLRERFINELGHVTPKVGAEAAIINAAGEILLMDRVDGSGWCLPCGWIEPGESPAEATIRETFEETGLVVTIRQLVGIFTRRASVINGPHSMVAVTHWCEIKSGTLTLSHEGLDLRYWPIDQVPRWHATHEDYARAALALWAANGALPAISK